MNHNTPTVAPAVPATPQFTPEQIQQIHAEIAKRQDVKQRMHIQRQIRTRLVPLQHNHRDPIRTHNIPKSQRPSGKQIRQARAAERRKKKAEWAEPVATTEAIQEDSRKVAKAQREEN